MNKDFRTHVSSQLPAPSSQLLTSVFNNLLETPI
jgi:hypothetical protein